jgi:hypothetical protein
MVGKMESRSNRASIRGATRKEGSKAMTQGVPITKRLTKRNGRLALGQHVFQAGGGMMLKMWNDWIPGRVEYNLFGEPVFYPSGEHNPIGKLLGREARVWE